MRLLLLDNYDSFTWNLFHALAKYHDDIDVRRNDELEPEATRKYDALVISPGPGLPHEAGLLPHILPLFAESKPVLGICLGHQAILEWCGAKLQNLDQVVHGKERWCSITDADDPVFHGIKDGFIAGRYHSWIVDRDTLPSQIIVSSVDEQGHVMSIRHKELPLWGMQFHPESVMTPQGERMINNWINAIQR